MKKYLPTWESLDTRPVPEWFDKAKLGIFVHWGIYSVPAFAPRRQDVEKVGLCYAEWYGWQVHEKWAPYFDFHKRVYGENFKYEDFAVMFKGEMFDAARWTNLFKRAGAKYLTLVTKHHDAFCMWPSKYSTYWNSVDIGPHRDIVGELFAEARKAGIVPGAYYSLLEWFHPVMRIPDIANADIPSYAVEKMIPQMKELIETYKPEVLFTDGEWVYPSEKWHSTEFLAWLFNESSVKDKIVINDRWGSDTRCRHGGYFGTEYGEVGSPSQKEDDALKSLVTRKWEENRSIGASYGYNRNEDIEDYLAEDELIHMFTDIVSRGGNLCLNVGPCADGTIAPIIQERLLQLGGWLDICGEAIYESKPVNVKGLPDGVVATKKGDCVYIICNKYPTETLKLECDMFRENAKIIMLGSNAEICGQVGNGNACFSAPKMFPQDMPVSTSITFKIL